MIKTFTAGLLAALLALAQTESSAAEAERARALAVAGQYDKAINIYRELLRAYPTNAELLLNVTVVEFKAGHYPEAVQHAESALEQKPDLAPASLFLGASYLKLREPARAIEPLRRAVKAVPSDRNAHVLLAEALRSSGSYVEAVSNFRYCAELLPDSPPVWYGLGQSYDALAAEAALRLQTGADRSSYWLKLVADNYTRQRRFGSALATFREALAQGPIIAGLHAGLARVYRETGHASWAATEETAEREVELVEQADSIPARDYSSYVANQKLATDAYGRLMQLPASLESELYQAKTFIDGGDQRIASDHWRKALAYDPEDMAIRISLGKSLFESQDYAAALPILQRVLSQTPSLAEPNFLCGASLVHLDQPEQAIPYLQAAVRQDSHFRAAEAALGQALLQMGKPTQAIPHLKLAITDATDPNTLFQLFRAYQLTGDHLLAKQTLGALQQQRRSVEEQRRFEDGSSLVAPSS